MKVLYDEQVFTLQKIGGISRYIHELASRNKKAKIGTLYTENFYLNKKQRKIPNFRGKIRCMNYLNRKYSILKLKQNNFDIFHPTYYDNYFTNYLKKPFVLTVHDMIHEIFVGTYYEKSNKTTLMKKELCLKANGIITVSENTKKDLIKIYGIDEKKIKVIYLGSNLSKKNNKINLPKKYILFTGGRGNYKNFKNFLEASSLILKVDKELKLICTGADFKENEKTMIKELGVEGKVINILAKDEDMYTIYNKAECFVFPSLYEGFGIPILEAFEAETPLVLSNTSCFPEIAGEAGEYFDPTDKKSMEKAIKNVLYNPERKKELIAKGRERLKLFSWDKTYQETMEFYKEIVEKSKNKR